MHQPMFVIQVTPLIRGTQLESLSYFSSIEYEIGSFLKVPIRGKQQPAIVTETRPVSSTKTALKAASFSLRKLPQQDDLVVLPMSIRTTAKELTKLYPVSSGAILFQLLPPDVRNGNLPYPKVEATHERHEESTPEILTARVDERFLSYQSLIRSTLAKRASVMLVVPTTTEVRSAEAAVGQGIKDRIVLLSPEQTKRQRTAAYEAWTNTDQPKLLITTPSHAYLERSDLGTIIIEQAASAHFIMRQRPHLDHREALKTYAKASGRSILFGDTVPRTEDEVKRREDIYFTHGEEVRRIAFPADLTIITQQDKPRPDLPFQLFSDELVRHVEHTIEARGHVFFFAARRGLAPVVACVDCGHIFRCPDSNTPYSLLRTKHNGIEERWFVSGTSGRRVRAADVCASCGSWRLRERGIGIQHIYDEWQKLKPEIPISILDNTTAKTTKQACTLTKDFFAGDPGILLGTQVAIPFLSPKVTLSAIISLDATRSIPTWRADEYLFRLLLRLREYSEKEVIIQTRSEPDNLLLYATRGAIERFFDDEIALRKMLSYPPFSRFVLLTWQGKASSMTALEAPIKNILADLPVQLYTNPLSTEHKTTRHALIRVFENEVPYSTIVPKLRAIPPYVKIEIDPERIV
jgi:primosomal protein N'